MPGRPGMQPLRSLPISLTVGNFMHAHARQREVALGPQIGFWLLRWCGGWRAGAGTGCSYGTGTHVCPT